MCRCVTLAAETQFVLSLQPHLWEASPDKFESHGMTVSALFPSVFFGKRRAAWRAGIAAGFLAASVANASAEKPPLVPDPAPALTTASRVSAIVEFGLPALAAEIDKKVPKRLATIDERINCVHKTILVFKVNANCDITGFIEKTSPVSLSGRGDHIIGALSIYGAAEGQGANRITERIHGQTEARATVEADARPQLRKDWSVDLNISDGFHWNEPPFLHVLGHDIALARFVEPKIKEQLAKLRERAQAAVQKADLRGKAASAWKHAFEPIRLSDNPPVWLQLAPQTAAFSGVRADAKALSGSLELAGTAQTEIGQQPAPVTPTALPPLGDAVSSPGTFDIILPVRIGYEALKDKLKPALASLTGTETAVREVDLYPSSGKLVVGVRLAKASDTDANAGQWAYLSFAPKVDADKQTFGLGDVEVNGTIADAKLAALVQQIAAHLKDAGAVDYGVAYQNLLSAANEHFNRPLKDGFRMEGRLTSARLEKVSLLADGIVIGLHAGGDLKILYRL